MLDRRWRQQAFLLAWIGLCMLGTARCEQPTEKATQDKQISDALRDMHNRAADLFNGQKDYNGAYRMFQGGLYVVRPLLKDRPDVQQLVDAGLQEAERMPSLADRAMRLHKAIEDIRLRLRGPAETKPGASPAPPLVSPPPSPPPANSTLYKRLGGDEGVKKIVDRLFTLLASDPKVGTKFTFLQKEPEEALKAKVAGFIRSVGEGTPLPPGKTLAEELKSMNLNAEQFDAFTGSLRAALMSNTVAGADIDELMKKVEALKPDVVGK